MSTLDRCHLGHASSFTRRFYKAVILDRLLIVGFGRPIQGFQPLSRLLCFCASTSSFLPCGCPVRPGFPAAGRTCGRFQTSTCCSKSSPPSSSTRCSRSTRSRPSPASRRATSWVLAQRRTQPWVPGGKFRGDRKVFSNGHQTGTITDCRCCATNTIEVNA